MGIIKKVGLFFSGPFRALYWHDKARRLLIDKTELDNKHNDLTQRHQTLSVNYDTLSAEANQLRKQTFGAANTAEAAVRKIAEKETRISELSKEARMLQDAATELDLQVTDALPFVQPGEIVARHDRVRAAIAAFRNMPSVKRISARDREALEWAIARIDHTFIAEAPNGQKE